MAKLFLNSIRRIIVQAGGGVIFGLQQGVRQAQRITRNAFPAATGIVHAVRRSLVNTQVPAVDHQVIATGIARQDIGTGTVHAFDIAPEEFSGQPAQSITQIDVTNTTGYDNGGTAGYAVAGDNDWQDVANFNNRTEAEASIQGGKGVGSLEEKGGGIRGIFPSPNAGKDGQSILSAELRVYLRQTGTVLDNGTLVWRLAGSISIPLGSETGNVDQEYIYDITADVAGDWNNLRGLKIEVEGSSALLGRACYARRAYITVVSERTITL